MPTQELVAEFVRHLELDRHLSPATVHGYEDELHRMLTRQVLLEPEFLALFVGTGDQGQPLAPNTRNRRLVILRAFIAYLRARGHLEVDPTSSIEWARVPQNHRAALGVPELRQVLATLRQRPPTWRRTRDETILLVLFHTGLRISELRSLELNQVDLQAGVLRSTKRKGGAFVDVPLNDEARAGVASWMAARPITDTAAVFVGGARPHRLSVRILQKRLAALGEAAGLGTRLHPHALRHAHATALLRVGTPTEVIRQSLNHASIGTTQRYLHSDIEILRAALRNLPKLDEGVPPFETPTQN